MRRLLILVAVLWANVAAADEASPTAWHAGLNIRTDLGTHPIRVDGGVLAW